MLALLLQLARDEAKEELERHVPKRKASKPRQPAPPLMSFPFPCTASRSARALEAAAKSRLARLRGRHWICMECGRGCPFTA